MNPIFQTAGLQVFERGWLSSNNVLFHSLGSLESVLVDSGYCTHAEQTVALVRRALGAGRLDRIINTHLHSDHCGGNHALQLEFNCAIDVPAGEAENVDRWDEEALSFRAMGQHCPRFRRTRSIRGGSPILLGGRIWQVIASPGHDPESVVLFEPDLRILISGDALWEYGFGVVFPELEGVSAFDLVRDTLNRLAELPVRWVIPGHGQPFETFHAAIDRAHRRLDTFVSDPRRHARYAVKVLIKFRLLEIQQTSLPRLVQWLELNPCARVTHATYFHDEPFSAWCMELIAELRQSGAIAVTSENSEIVDLSSR